MKLINFIKKYQLIILLVVVIVLLIFVKLKSKNQSPSNIQNTPGYSTQNSESIKPTPTINPEDDPEETLDLDYDFPLGRILPYEGQSFRVERYKDINLLEIIIKNNADYDTAKKEIDAWLVENGVEKDDKYEFKK